MKLADCEKPCWTYKRQLRCRKGGKIMATTAIWDVTDRLDRVIDYATNPDKTENNDYANQIFQGLRNVLNYTSQDGKTEKQFYVSGINCDPATACKQMSGTKLQFQKNDGILAFHGYQSFAPGEANPETAHAIGVKLAQQLWGDRFEVIVSTHLDKHHLHNHFVLNSVFFIDGKRYYDNKSTYSLMRQASDRLCREYSLSVIQSPQKGKAKHYAEWKAEQEGKPTWRGIIREDVDKAISASMTFTQFIAALRKQGYKVKTGVKHMAVKPPGKERFVRLKTLGENYSEEVLKQRILQNCSPKRPHTMPEPKWKRYIIRGGGSLKATKRLSGLQALYFHYLYKMGILPKKRASNKRVHFLLREDLRYMEEITAQTKLLCTHNIVSKGSNTNDPFWERSETALLEALILYLLYEAPKEEQNFPMVMEMIAAAEVREDDETYQSPLDELFERLSMREPEHLAVKQYNIFKLAAGKTAKSILIGLGVRLEKFNLSTLAGITMVDEMELSSVGEKKTALFAVIPDNDSSFNFIVGMLYTQLFQSLMYLADYRHAGSLPVHVHFVMDEFANVALPDEFDKLLSTIGLALLVLFFVIGVVKTCGSFAEVKKPEHALKLFIRFALAKAVVTYGLELMLALFSIVQGIISTIMNSSGFGTTTRTVLPDTIV